MQKMGHPKMPLDTTWFIMYMCTKEVTHPSNLWSSWIVWKSHFFGESLAVWNPHQFTKHAGTEPYKAILGAGFPLTEALHTAHIGGYFHFRYPAMFGDQCLPFCSKKNAGGWCLFDSMVTFIGKEQWSSATNSNTHRIHTRYLWPTLTIKINQLKVYIPYMDPMW